MLSPKPPINSKTDLSIGHPQSPSCAYARLVARLFNDGKVRAMLTTTSAALDAKRRPRIELRAKRRDSSSSTPKHAAQNRLHRRMYMRTVCSSESPPEESKAHACYRFSQHACASAPIHAVDFLTNRLPGKAGAHDNRYGHHARTVNGEHVAIGQDDRRRQYPAEHRSCALSSVSAHKRARISLVLIE